MRTTSTYTKHFFLPGENLSLSNVSTNFGTKKFFSLLKEDFFVQKSFSSKKDLDMTKNIIWICTKCGHTHVGATATSTCPICNGTYKKTSQ